MYLEFKGGNSESNSLIAPTRLCYGCENICFLACTGCNGCQKTCSGLGNKK